MYSCLSCALNKTFLFHGTPFFLERTSDRQSIVTQTYMTGRHLPERSKANLM